MKQIAFVLNKVGIDANIPDIPTSGLVPDKIRVSPIQLDVLAVLRVMYGRERVLSEYLIDKDLNLKCDVFVPHLKVALEIDGQPHFVGSSNLLTAKSAFRTGLQRDLGLKTVIVNHSVWSPLKGLNSKSKFMSDLINGALTTN